MPTTVIIFGWHVINCTAENLQQMIHNSSDTVCVSALPCEISATNVMISTISVLKKSLLFDNIVANLYIYGLHFVKAVPDDRYLQFACKILF